MMKKVFHIIVFLFLFHTVYGQFGYGTVVSVGLYDRYTNPTDEPHPSAGNVLLNLGIGPKVWLGSKNVSLSIEAIAHMGFTGYSSDDYKGMGMLAIPILAKINFAGLSSFISKGKMGLSLGGGLQYSKTELYGLDEEHSQFNREYFPTYVGEVGIGFGLNGAAGTLFYRYGAHPDNTAKTHNIGLNFDFNFVSLKKIQKKESMLF